MEIDRAPPETSQDVRGHLIAVSEANQEIGLLNAFRSSGNFFFHGNHVVASLLQPGKQLGPHGAEKQDRHLRPPFAQSVARRRAQSRVRRPKPSSSWINA